MMNDINFLYLNRKEVQDTGIDMPLVMRAVEDSLKLFFQGETKLPHKTVLDMDERKWGRCNAMPAYVGGDYNVFGIKWIASFPNNPLQYHLPRATGFLILNDSKTGLPLAVMDCSLLSAMRTGAVTGVGAKYLARPDAETVAMIGTGVQAYTQMEALMFAVPGLKKLRAFDIRREACEQYAARMGKRWGLEAEAVNNPKTAVQDADIIVTVTIADEPIVKNSWLKPGSFFAAMGSYQEEEFAVVSNSDKIVVDSKDAVLHRRTPVIALMLEQGLIREDDICEIGAILCGQELGRKQAEERIFYSPIGLAVEDICVCYQVYKRAVEKKIGTTLDLFGGIMA